MSYIDSIQDSIKDMIDIISKEKNLSYEDTELLLKDSILATIKEEFDIQEEIVAEFVAGRLKTYFIKDDKKIEKDILSGSRLTVHTILKHINSRFNEIEKKKEVEYFSDKIGNIMIGKIQKINPREIVVQINGFSTAMPKPLAHPLDKTLNINSKVQVLIDKVDQDAKIYQTTVSRSSAEFIRKLLETEIPEIHDQIIVIKDVARIPGRKTKVAVFCPEQNMDPVSSCLGVKGARIQMIRKEVHNELIDIIEYSTVPEQYIANAIMPARPLDIIEESSDKYLAVVRNDEISLAMGKFMSNMKLTSELTKYDVTILSEEEYDSASKTYNNQIIEQLTSALSIDEMTARLLIASGFKSLDAIASSNEEDLESKGLSGYDKAEINRIYNTAIQILIKEEESILQRLEELGVDQDIIDFIPLENKNIYIQLAEIGVKSPEDLLYVDKTALMSILAATDISEDELDKILSEAKEKL